MRFNQLKANSNSIVRKKLYKKGKVWLVASMLSFAGVLMLSSVPVKATVTNDSTQQTDTTTVNDDQSSNQNETTSITKTLAVSSNLGDINISVSGQKGTTVEVSAPTKTGYTITSAPTITVQISADGSLSTNDSIVYAANTDSNTEKETDSVGSTQSQSEDSTNTQAEDSYIYTGDNVKQNDDGSYSASVTYQGQTYDVDGKIDDTVRKTDSSGNAVTINIKATKQQKFTDPADSNSINMSNTTAVYDQYGRQTSQTLSGSKFVDAQMTDYEGNIFYNISDNADQWIKQGTGVEFTGEGTLSSEVVTTPVFIINDPKLYNGKYESVTEEYNADTGEVTGSVVVHSDYYDKDLTYSYTGKPGETVKATLDGNDSSMITPNVYVDIQASNPESSTGKVGTALNPGDTVTLAGPASHVYDLYNADGTKVDRGLAGDSTWATDSYIYIDGVPCYRVSEDEWFKQSDGVTYNGTVKPVDNTVYTATPYVEPLIVGDVSIDSNLDKQVVKEISGYAGNDVIVNVPDVSGYTKDKDSITAHINDDGTITTDESVTYTKIDSGNNGGSDSGIQLDFIKKSQNVSTFVGKGNVTLYRLSGTKFTPVMNRALAEQTDWYSDQYVKLDGMTYFRVATNEWVKISNVYRYKDLNMVVNTKNQTSRLLNDEGVLVMNRALGPRTSWLVDRIGYLGDDDNPTGFYRVATNEFLNTSDTLQ
jgi:KxYKxGKxW signal peptide